MYTIIDNTYSDEVFTIRASAQKHVGMLIHHTAVTKPFNVLSQCINWKLITHINVKPFLSNAALNHW